MRPQRITAFEVSSLKTKTLNFFKRRNILKKANFLDLKPVRMMEYEVLPDGMVDIHLPRFKNAVLRRALQPANKKEIIPIHLDKSGSVIWLAIDGTLNVGDLCSLVQLHHRELFQPEEETIKRVTDYLSILYRERYISFREILSQE